MAPLSSRPWSAQVELVEGCNRRCHFCGINGLVKPHHQLDYMTLATAQRVVSGLMYLAPQIRVEFAMHGEPLLHPEYLTIIRLFAHHLPGAQLMVTTNGHMLAGQMRERVEALLGAGLDYLVLDLYPPQGGALREEALEMGLPVWDFYSQCLPENWSPWSHHHHKDQPVVVLMDDLGERSGQARSRTIFNHAGNSPARPALTRPLAKTCTLPFREVAVCYDGDVCICCMDWGHEYTAGNVKTDALGAVWYGPRFEAARSFLANKRRAFTPCLRCDHPSGTRAGLLPKYNPPTQAQTAIVLGEVARARANPRIKLPAEARL